MLFPLAEVVKLVDTHVSGTCEETRGGSSPLLGTTLNISKCKAISIKQIVSHGSFPLSRLPC